MLPLWESVAATDLHTLGVEHASQQLGHRLRHHLRDLKATNQSVSCDWTGLKKDLFEWLKFPQA